MLGSGFEGEQASAARQAEAFRKRHGLTWEQMLSLPPIEPEPPSRDAAKAAAEAKAQAEAEAKTREADEARRRQWQAEIRAKGEADLAAQQAKWAAEDAARKAAWRAPRPPPEPPPAPPKHTSAPPAPDLDYGWSVWYDLGILFLPMIFVPWMLVRETIRFFRWNSWIHHGT
jgi:hypothetical protein